MVDVFAELRGSMPELRLVIGGPDWRGYSRVLVRHIASRGLEGSVSLPGVLSGVELVELYESARLFLLFSRCESFGLPALEAMRYGLPVAVARSAALPEVVGDAGFVLDPEAKNAGDDLGRLLLDDRRLASYSEAGTSRAADLSWAKAAERVALVVRDVIEQRR
jgi:alpha-1,3-rhamnosyl/mannosyltransferase